MARLSANAPSLVRHPLILFVEVMENLTVILVNWKKMLVRVTAMLQSHTTGFVNVSDNGFSFMLSVNRAYLCAKVTYRNHICLLQMVISRVLATTEKAVSACFAD